MWSNTKRVVFPFAHCNRISVLFWLLFIPKKKRNILFYSLCCFLFFVWNNLWSTLFDYFFPTTHTQLKKHFFCFFVSSLMFNFYVYVIIIVQRGTKRYFWFSLLSYLVTLCSQMRAFRPTQCVLKWLNSSMCPPFFIRYLTNLVYTYYKKKLNPNAFNDMMCWYPE